MTTYNLNDVDETVETVEMLGRLQKSNVENICAGIKDDIDEAIFGKSESIQKNIISAKLIGAFSTILSHGLKWDTPKRAISLPVKMVKTEDCWIISTELNNKINDDLKKPVFSQVARIGFLLKEVISRGILNTGTEMTVPSFIEHIPERVQVKWNQNGDTYILHIIPINLLKKKYCDLPKASTCGSPEHKCCICDSGDQLVWNTLCGKVPHIVCLNCVEDPRNTDTKCPLCKADNYKSQSTQERLSFTSAERKMKKNAKKKNAKK